MSKYRIYASYYILKGPWRMFREERCPFRAMLTFLSWSFKYPRVTMEKEN